MDGIGIDRRTDLCLRIASMAGIVADERDNLDRDRRLPQRLFDAMADADLFRILTPARFGGQELALTDLFEVIEAASRLDGSFAWVVTNGAIMSRMAAYLPEHVARDWFSDPDCLIASSTGAVGSAKKVDGGFRVSGLWPFASGIHGAKRVMALVTVDDGSAPETRTPIAVYLPVERVEVIDNWHVAGLRGTGSCNFRATDVFVSADHSHDFITTTPLQPGLQYLVPILSAFPLSVTLVALGLAAAAIEEFPALAERTRGGTSQLLRDRETIQTDLGRATMIHQAARALVRDALMDLQACVQNRSGDLNLSRARFRASLAHAGESSERVMTIICSAAGSSSIREDLPLERQHRDLLAAIRHIAMGPHNFTVFGRMSMGLDPGTVRY